jgi:maltose/moltooligosaccharide transporter
MSKPGAFAAATPATARKKSDFYAVGTLRYTQTGLYVLFFWLMWNDFSIMLLEQVGSLTQFLMKDLGATYTEIASVGTFGMIGMWINPVFSVWSDRHRGRLGRRRPFLFATTPFLAFFLMITPYMPDFYRYMVKFPWAATILSYIPMNGPVLFLVIDGVIIGLFNTMVLTVFSYLYWDVVPEIVLGRFTSLSKVATALATFVWMFYFFGYGEHHMKGVYMGVSMFCLVIYLTSVWQIKEGEYPPPDERKKGGMMAPVRAFFVECYSKPYFLWIFAGFSLFQIGNLGNDYRTFYLHYDLKLNLDQIGKASAIPQLLIIALGFGVGALADRLKPVRLMPSLSFLWALTSFGAYFFVRSQLSWLIWYTLINLAIFAQGVLMGALTPELYPREKLGQFCAASATMQTVICGVMRPFVGMFFTYIHYLRFSFLWSAFFDFLGALIFIKVYHNWRKLKGHAPVPHAG